MIIDFKNQNNDGRLIIGKSLFGFGFLLRFKDVCFSREKICSIQMDFLFIRFWWSFYKSMKFKKGGVVLKEKLHCFECEIEMPVKNNSGVLSCSNCGLIH